MGSLILIGPHLDSNAMIMTINKIKYKAAINIIATMDRDVKENSIDKI